MNSTDNILSLIRMHAKASPDRVLAELFSDLDTHLSTGGTPPEAWREGPDAPGCACDGSEPYVLHYISADAPGDDAPWSVYREQYISRDHDDPIDGSQEYVSTHPSEKAADAEARRLQHTVNNA